MNCLVLPNDMEGTTGVTLIEIKVAGVTVRVVEPLLDPKVAVIVVCPVARLVASPILGGALLIVATAGTELLQATEPLILRVLPSV